VGVGSGASPQRTGKASFRAPEPPRERPLITATDSSAVGQWRVTDAKERVDQSSSSDDGQTLLARVSQGPNRAGDSSQSIPRMESAGGAKNLMGGRPDREQPCAGWEGEGPVPRVNPCGRVQDHERKQPDRTPVGGGHGREHARVRIQRA